MSTVRVAAALIASLALVSPSSARQGPARQPAQTIVLTSFAYAPRPIHLAAGRAVTLTFVNRSGSGHDFTARRFFASSQILAGAAPGGEVELRPGQAAAITLVPRPGRYPVHCSHFLHTQMGMSDLILVD